MKRFIACFLLLTTTACGVKPNRPKSGEVAIDRGAGVDIMRSRVPGGWLYYFDDYHGGMAFVPDANAERQEQEGDK